MHAPQSDHPKHASTDHPVLQIIAERFSPYAFDPRPLDRGDLLTCLEAARWAASSFNEQPWRFILAERTDREAFDRALGCLVEGNRTWAAEASVLLLGLVRRTFTHNDKPNRVAEHDLGIATGNLSLQAQALGISVHAMAGIEIDQIRSVYAVPEGFDPVTAIALGYAADPNQFADGNLASRDLAPRTRKPLEDWVFSEAFGKAADLG